MAAPVVAGTALLIRQYFMDMTQRFWTKMCNRAYFSCRAFQPSGVLIKAVILHSGSRMRMINNKNCGCMKTDTILGDTPDFSQGYGRVTLKNVLPLFGLYTFDLFVEDMIPISANSKLFYYTYVSTSSTPLK